MVRWWSLWSWQRTRKRDRLTWRQCEIIRYITLRRRIRGHGDDFNNHSQTVSKNKQTTKNKTNKQQKTKQTNKQTEQKWRPPVKNYSTSLDLHCQIKSLGLKVHYFRDPWHKPRPQISTSWEFWSSRSL